MHWSASPLHFLDFEGNLTSGILEYGVVTVQGTEVTATETRLCGAIGGIRSADTALHGLSEPDVANHRPFADFFDRFALLREAGPLGAHFAQAENGLIKAVWPYPRTSPDFSRPGQSLTEWGPWLDTGRLYLELFPQLSSAKLADLVEMFQLQKKLDALAAHHCPETRRHFHAALYDALAAALLFLDLIQRPEFSEATLPWLLQRSMANPEKRRSLQQRDLF